MQKRYDHGELAAEVHYSHGDTPEERRKNYLAALDRLLKAQLDAAKNHKPNGS